MTTPRYHNGCTAGSQDRGNAAAWAPARAAWWVLFNLGGVVYVDVLGNYGGWGLAVRSAGQ